MALETWTLGDHNARPHVLITGGVHGDEFEPMAAVRRVGTSLAGRELKGRVTLVPVVNDAAFRLGRRAADDGLDLARTCPGRAEGSITERTAYALSALIRDADAYIDLHTGGLALQVYPLAGYLLHRDPAVLERQRRMARRFGLPIVWGTDPDLDGRSLSVARDANVPAIYAEYLGGGAWNPDGVAAYVRGCFNVLADLGVIAGEIELPPGNPLIVEDARPGAGHMQVRHPAPCDGLFEPLVTLGSRVLAGQTIGTISDHLGRNVAPVAADASGIVLVLRTFARVSRGDSLGVVMETQAAVPSFP